MLPTFYQKNEYSRVKSLYPVKPLMTLILGLVCLFLCSARVQGQKGYPSSKGKTSEELTKILVKFLCSKQPRYFGRDDRIKNQRRPVVTYFGYTVKSVDGTTLTGFRVDRYKTAHDAKLKKNGQVYVKFPGRIDIKNIHIGYTYPANFHDPQYRDGVEVVAWLNSPSPIEFIREGKSVKFPNGTQLTFVLSNGPDGKYVRDTLFAIQRQPRNVANNNPTQPTPPKTSPPAPDFSHHNNKQIATKFDPKEWEQIKDLVSPSNITTYTFDSGDEIAIETSSDSVLPTTQFYFTVTALPLNENGTSQASAATPEWFKPVEYATANGAGFTPRRVLKATSFSPFQKWTVTIPPQEDANLNVPNSYVEVRIYVRKAK